MAFEGRVELVRQKYKKNNKKFYLALNIVVCQLFRIFAAANCILIK